MCEELAPEDQDEQRRARLPVCAPGGPSGERGRPQERICAPAGSDRGLSAGSFAGVRTRWPDPLATETDLPATDADAPATDADADTPGVVKGRLIQSARLVFFTHYPCETGDAAILKVGRRLGRAIDSLVRWEYVRDASREFLAQGWIREGFDGD